MENVSKVIILSSMMLLIGMYSLPAFAQPPGIYQLTVNVVCKGGCSHTEKNITITYLQLYTGSATSHTYTYSTGNLTETYLVNQGQYKVTTSESPTIYTDSIQSGYVIVTPASPPLGIIRAPYISFTFSSSTTPKSCTPSPYPCFALSIMADVIGGYGN